MHQLGAEVAGQPGYLPKQDEMPGIEFDWQRELSDVTRIIQQVKDRTDDAALEASFRTEALARLKAEGREPHERTVRAAVANQRRRWVTEEQIRLGLERARHWGWTNIYTYSKALGEQALAATEGLEWCIVRPAIVESALEYPFPGWNEGMNTSAPLAYLGLHGQVDFPGDNDLILDVVPVDFVASTTLAAAAALLEGETSRVYQVAAGDVNPCTMARTITLVGLYKRRKTKAKLERGEINRTRAEFDLRREPQAISRATFERVSTPLVAKWVRRARGVLDEMAPERYGPLGAAVSRARQKVKEVEDDLDRVLDAFDLFMPFIWENRYVFTTKNARGLFDRMSEADRALLPYDTEGLDWRRYWLDVHMPGLERWVFPKLDLDGPKRIAIPRDYRDLAELFDVRTREHGRHIAYRRLGGDSDSEAFTFRDVRKAAFAASRELEAQGVGEGDRVLLVSEGRPEWGMSYFGIVLGGAVAVPVDVDLSAREIANVARASGAKLAVCSPQYSEQLSLLARTYENGASNGVQNGNGRAPAEPFPIPIVDFEVLFRNAHAFDEVDDVKPKRRRPEDPASIIFTSGTTGRPKGVVLSHQNFAALTARMSALFDLNRTDAMLSVLPPHHTFEFSAGLLMPLAKGSSVTYLEERTPELISRAFDETTVTAMVGVPAVVESLHRKIQTQVESLVWPVRMGLKGLIRVNESLRDRYGLNLGRALFRPVHAAFGGRLRYLVSGAAPLKPEVFRDLRGLGFGVHEGYGLTEASPVLTVGWPRHKTPAGSVGWPLPGIEVRILDANDDGVGEVIARGPTIMRGYLDAPEETDKALKEGWLHTGDRGRLDEEGRLFIVGREKDTIIDSSGKNVYPDEIEELYADHPLIEELSVVGVPAEHGPGERVACLVVPAYGAEVEGETLSRAEVRDRVRTHFRNVSGKLPFARRVKVMHLWDHELPRTSTRKVKRTLVREELLRLERAAGAGRNGGAVSNGHRRDQTEAWVVQTVAAIARRRSNEVHTHSRLVDDLGFDSLMQLELLTTLETERPGARVSPDALAEAGTVGEVVALARKSAAAEPVVEERASSETSGSLPSPVRALGRAALGLAARVAYEGMLDVKVEGRGNIPANRNFIVASNHASHLDMGLVKHALGDFGAELRTLAAKDYFFDEPGRRLYFENFTNLLPMDRHGALKKSLRLASGAIRRGETLLIFPEGTRSRDGIMSDFKPAIGWLSLHERVDVLPMWLGGTHDALPVGSRLPKARKLEVRIGDPVDFRKMLKRTEGMSRSAAYRFVTREVERRVRALAGLPPLPEPEDPQAPESREEQPHR
ncbi:MAG: AMP-binding protein [Myxococcota bacterium]